MDRAQPTHPIIVQTLRQWMDEGRSFYLIDTLPPDHFQAVHLPGAVNACVFDVTFMDQMLAITSDRQAEIVVYGASERSMEAPVAAEKLQRHGFVKVYTLMGGIDTWISSGLPVAPEATGPRPAPQNRLRLESGIYRVDARQSAIEWAGRNPSTKHDGTIDIAAGEIQVSGGRLSGTFEIDMHTIVNRNLAGDPLQPVLIAHLHSDDFFRTDRFPRAVFSIREASLVGEAYVGAPNLNVQGALTLRGVTADLDFLATANQVTRDVLNARAQFELDRTRWNIVYGSARFFEHLGMHLVHDAISIDLKIVAYRQ